MIRLPLDSSLVSALGRVWVSLLPLGCSIALDAGRAQCQAERDCTAGAEALMAARCVDELCETRPECSRVNAPAPLAPASPTVDVAPPVVHLLVPQAAGPRQARLCQKLDLDCEAPTQSMTLSGSGDHPPSLEPGPTRYYDVDGLPAVPATVRALEVSRMRRRAPVRRSTSAERGRAARERELWVRPGLINYVRLRPAQAGQSDGL